MGKAWGCSLQPTKNKRQLPKTATIKQQRGHRFAELQIGLHGLGLKSNSTPCKNIAALTSMGCFTSVNTHLQDWVQTCVFWLLETTPDFQHWEMIYRTVCARGSLDGSAGRSFGPGWSYSFNEYFTLTFQVVAETTTVSPCTHSYIA